MLEDIDQKREQRKIEYAKMNNAYQHPLTLEREAKALASKKYHWRDCNYYALEIEAVNEMKRLSGDKLEPNMLYVTSTYASSQTEKSSYTSQVSCDVRNGVVICTNQRKDFDKTLPPARLANTDLIAQQDLRRAEARSKAPENLKYVWRYHITNPTTLSIIKSIGVGIETAATFARDTEQFCELLATPNRKGVCYMLKDYCSTFGWKSFESVTTMFDAYVQSFDMLFTLCEETSVK
ncbi:hypothetical protein CKM354_000010600 [Cercospora kikuchii]|uniref:Uncharacterized protein n=1 Tax=Cercospora kikuchii TaxID=84275 RepID=A0A9P3C8F0_9PEZI|nr:uncharacterized protein CKM354_000010600 [Cercospora kikuchii]GIZ36636.1 hypothetical protein CKM354_000010600 [Cercospora kikuchii]